MELPVRGQHVFSEDDGIKIILTNPAKFLLNPAFSYMDEALLESAQIDQNAVFEISGRVTKGHRARWQGGKVRNRQSAPGSFG
jgi:ERCC4-related helicase